MAKQVSEGRWVCEYPGCKYENTKEGYVRNHEKLKHGNPGQQQGGKEKSKKDEASGGNRCPDCKGQNFRLLNSGIPTEGQARLQGLKYICDDCEEVW